MGKCQAVLLILSEKLSLKFRHFAHGLQAFLDFLDLVNHRIHNTEVEQRDGAKFQRSASE